MTMRLIGLSGWSGAGKTTVIAAVIPALRARGLTVSTVKHAHHAFEIDRPGKDSFVHRQAGASEVLVASRHRYALMHELRDEPEPPLSALLRRLAPVDLVIVEGFKRDAHPKLEIHRVATGKDVPASRRSRTSGRSRPTRPGPFPIPRLDIDDIAAITDWLIGAAKPIGLFLAQENAASGLRRRKPRLLAGRQALLDQRRSTGSRSATESIDVVGARGLQRRMGRLGEALAVGGRGSRPLLLRQPQRIAGQRDADGPGAGGPALGDARLGVVDLDDRAGRIDPEIGEAAIHHQRRWAGPQPDRRRRRDCRGCSLARRRRARAAP